MTIKVNRALLAHPWLTSLVKVLLDEGYLGLRRDHPHQALTPPRKPNKSALPEFHERWKCHRHAHSSGRITVENALADHKTWKQPMRRAHRRENLPATHRAITGIGLRPDPEHLTSTTDGTTMSHPLSRTNSLFRQGRAPGLPLLRPGGVP